MAIRGLYEKYLAKLANESFENERVWETTDERVGFSVYEQENGDTHVYFLAVDWYHMAEEKRTAILRIENSEYPIDVPFGTLLKCVVSGERFAYACDENGEVLSVQEDMLTVQGTGVVEFRYCKDGTCQSVRVDFKDESVKNITI